MPPKEEKKEEKAPEVKVDGATTDASSTDPEKKVEGVTTDESSTDPEKKGDVPGKNPATENCEGKDSCAGEKFAKILTGDLGEIAKKKAAEAAKKVAKSLLTTFTNPAKCASLAVGSVPLMITSIGKSISDAFDKISNSINNAATAMNKKGFNGIFGPFKIAGAMFMLKLQGVINNIALGPDAEIILSNPQMTAKILFDKLILRSKLYKLALEDAEIRGVLKIFITEYVNNLLLTLQIAQPDIDRVNAKIKSIIEGVGDNIGESLGHALVNVIASVLGALPVVGGVVSAIKGADQLGQEILNTCKPPITKGAGILMPMINGFNKQKSRLDCEVAKFTNKIEPVIKRVEAKLNVGQKGGGNLTKKQQERNIHNTTKRVNYLLKRFTGKRRHKINYTRRLLQSRLQRR
jgi:hypothetical protein